MEAKIVKYINLVIGFILFSSLLFVLFYAAGDMGKTYESEDYETYQRLSNTYGNESSIDLEKNTTFKKMSDYLSEAEFSTVSAAVGAIDKVLQAGKLLKDSISTTSRVSYQVQEDSQGKIHPQVPLVINSIIYITIILIILTIFIKVRLET